MPHGVAGIYINVATNVLLDINIQQGSTRPNNAIKIVRQPISKLTS